MIPRTFEIPDSISKRIDLVLQKNKASLASVERLAGAVKRLADHFTGSEGVSTPWLDPELALAYVLYYFPLNFVRLQSVLQEALVQFPWQDVRQIIDFGSGPGTLHAVLECSPLAPKALISVEISERATALHRSMDWNTWPCTWKTSLPASIGPGTLGVFSYSLLEAPAVGDRLAEFDHLLIVSPSTRDQGRQLLSLRKTLMEQGYASWAPCIHQEACPLLSQSKTDWCHDRIFFSGPDWYKKLESHLPFYNHTLTFSYWFASRAAKPSFAPNMARVVGDTLYEKGKVRQMICRGPKREFLAWLRRHGDPEPIPRGSRIELSRDLQPVGNELRPPKS